MPSDGFGVLLRQRGFLALLSAHALGIVNDNAFKTILALYAVSQAGSPAQSSQTIALAGAIFVLPYLLFSSAAGYLADRYSKQRVIVIMKVAEIAIMGVGVAATASRHLPALMVVLFLLGVHSALLSPAKLGILPEILRDEDLSRANGLMEFGTYAGIIGGTVVGGLLFASFRVHLTLLMGLFVIVAVGGALASLAITPVAASGSTRRFSINFIGETWASLSTLRGNRPLFLTILAIAYFWLLGSIFLINVPVYGGSLMHLEDRELAWLNAAVSIGLGIGGLVAGKLSGDQVELGLVPIGSIGLGLLAVDLGFAYTSYTHAITGHLLLGLAGGLFIVPLNAYLQYKSERSAKGEAIGVANVLTFLGVMLGSAITWAAAGPLALAPNRLLLLVGLATFGVTAYILTILPDFLVRLCLWLLTHTVYRITVLGRAHLPKDGPVLLVGNHISYVDPFLVSACTQRFVRFLMYRPLYEAQGIHWFARLMGAIPVAESDSRSGMMAALKTARERLQSGEVVCIFAEGAVSRTGNLLPFKKGFEAIVKGLDIPVVPFHLDGVWGSIFSFQGGRVFFKRPRRIPYPVTISFGTPLRQPGAFEVRQAVMLLGAEAATQRPDRKSLGEAALITAKHQWRNVAMADSLGHRLRFGQVLVGALLFRHDVVKRCDGQDMVGLLLPPSVPAALLNFAITMAGKVPVNLNYTASEEALRIAIDRCDLKTIYTSRSFLEKVGVPHHNGMVFVEEVSGAFTRFGKLRTAFLLRLTPVALLRRLLLPRDLPMESLATVIFSSGSTGIPKGVMLSHRNIVSNIEAIRQVMQIDQDDCLLGVLPFFHSFGFTGALWLPLLSGFGVVYHANPLDARTVGQLCEQYRATLLIGTPAFYLSYLRRCSKEQFATLRLAIVGAEKLKGAVAEAFRDRFDVDLLEGYGCTELSPVVSVNIPNVIEARPRQVGHKPDTAGHPLPGIAVRIVDPDSWCDRQVDEEGLVVIKGPNVMLGYLHDPERTQQVIRDGWYITGDVGRLDVDGFLTVTDRLARFSKIGGEMVPHIKIEEAIQTALGTHEPKCVVTSLPDDQKGERLIVLHGPLQLEVDEILHRLREMGVPNLWLPRKENFLPIDAIPLLGTGKLDLKRAKELAAELDWKRQS